ncbi:unnamed protein product, partial [marine sediment metagenome]
TRAFEVREIGHTGADALMEFKNGQIDLKHDLNISDLVLTLSDVTLDGNRKKLTLGSSGEILVDKEGVLTLADIKISGLQDDNLRCFDNATSIVSKNSELVLSHNFTFSTGSFLFEDDSIISGTNQFVYSSTVGSTISSGSRLLLDHNSTFSYDPNGILKNDLISFEDETSILHLKNCTMHVTATGLQLTKGTLLVEGTGNLTGEGINEIEGIIFGDGTAANDLNIDISPADNLIVSGYVVYKNVN